MSDEVAVSKTSGNPLAILGSKFQVDSASMVEVLRGTVIKADKNGRQATNEELVMFAIVANQYDLNPFTREIYAFAAPGKGIVAIVPIDGWTKIVNRHKDSNGQNDFDGCEFVEIDGKNGLPESITCKLHIKGRSVPVSVTERYAECKRDTSPWAQHPYRMLRHKAYMQAARYAFGLGGIHDEDEARDIINVTPPVDHTPIAPPKEKLPSKQEQSPPSADGDTITGTLMGVEEIPFKKKDGTASSRYALIIDGVKYGTFSQTLFDEAAALVDTEVHLTYSLDKTGKYKNAEAIVGA